MSNFYTTKHHKRDDYKKMVQFLKNDRPLTSDIRRRNYKLVTSDSIQEIDKYRAHSEMERVGIKYSNASFYRELLKMLEGYQADQLTLSGQIIERTRNILENNYVLDKGHFSYIREPCERYRPDTLSNKLLSKIERFIHEQAN